MATDPLAPSDGPDPRWYYVFLAGVVCWFLVAAGFSVLGVEAMLTPLGAMLVLLAWVLLPLGVYFDAQTVAREGFDWDPSPSRWAYLCFVWFVNLPVAAYYLYKRQGAMAGFFALSGPGGEDEDDDGDDAS